MSLNFPNPSRSFDEQRHSVRFTGYDGAFEVAFLVSVEALGGSPADSESGCLAAFDRMRSEVQDVAREVYSHGRQHIYMITAEDLR